ncbi:MAG: PhoH family protein, partial [Bdellovibrionota bacterium]
YTPIANQYLVMKDQSNPNHSAIGRYSRQENRIVPLVTPSESIWGIHPRNAEQSFALDCLLNDEILFVSLVGKAGTGKTLLALAAGLYKTLDEGRFQRLLVSRPIFPMGRDIGYLPGDVEQKLNPWMQPIFDNVEFLMGSDKKAAGRARELINQGMVNIEPLTYIRGRSIPHQYLIVDEAQNLTPHEIKTIVTRAGQGTKVVLTGDPYQIDNPYVDSANSGLTYSVERFKGQPIAAHVSLAKGERSELAELAANIL